MSRQVDLQQRVYSLRERERLAKQHNKQLMQQFKEAEDTLREMLDRTEAMKMLRKDYEKYFESGSYWDYPLKHKTQTAQENTVPQQMTGVYLNAQKNSKDQLSESNNTPLFKQGLGKTPIKMRPYQELAAPLEQPPSWQAPAHLHTRLFPNRMSNNPWDISQASMSTLLPFSHSHLFRPQHFPSIPSHLHSSSQHESVSTDYPCHCLANRYHPNHNESSQLYTNQPFLQSAQETGAGPKRPQSVTISESNSTSQELEFKPVRLSSDQAMRKDSSQELSQETKEKRKMSDECCASQTDQLSSQESSESRSVATNSGSEESSDRSGLDFKKTNINSEFNSVSHGEENETDAKESRSDAVSQSETEQQESRKEIEKEQSISDQSSLEDEEEVPEKEQIGLEAKEKSQQYDKGDNQHQAEDTDHELNTTEDKMDLEKTEESVSSEAEKDEAKSEGQESTSENTTHGSEESDSEDCIISPQSRSKTIYVIPEHPAAVEEESSKMTSSYDNQDSSVLSEEEENIELLLAPQGQAQTHKGKPKADDKSKAPCDSVARFCVKEADHHSDSDHFYD